MEMARWNLRRAVGWLLLVFALLLVITGLGITEWQIVEAGHLRAPLEGSLLPASMISSGSPSSFSSWRIYCLPAGQENGGRTKPGSA